MLGDISREYPSVKVLSVVTAIGMQPGPSPESFMREHDLRFPAAVDDADGTLASSLGVSGFPTIYFVNADGTVAATMVGEPAGTDLHRGFQALQAQAA